MGVLVGGAILASWLIGVSPVLAWQGGRSRRDDAAVYVIDDAAAFVHGRLAPPTAARVSRPLVYRVLEWQIEYQQVVAPRAGEHPVIGSGDAIEHVLSRAAERGDVIDPIDVAEINAPHVGDLMGVYAVR